MDINNQSCDVPNLSATLLPIPPAATQSLPLLPASLISTPALIPLRSTPIFHPNALMPLQNPVFLHHLASSGMLVPPALNLGLVPPTAASTGLPFLVQPLPPSGGLGNFEGVDSLLRAAESSGLLPAETEIKEVNLPATQRQEPLDSWMHGPKKSVELAQRANSRKMDETEQDETSEDASDDISIPPLSGANFASISPSHDEIARFDSPNSLQASATGYTTRSKSKQLSRQERSQLANPGHNFEQPNQLDSSMDVETLLLPLPVEDTTWDSIDLSSVSLSVPKLYPTHMPDSRSLFINSLAFVDTKAPLFEKMDSPSVWSVSATAPLLLDYVRLSLVPKHVPNPIFLLGQSSAPETFGKPPRTSSSNSTTSSSVPTKSRKKRTKGESPFDELGPEALRSERAGFGLTAPLLAPVPKRPKSREKISVDFGENHMEGVIEEEDVPEESAAKVPVPQSAKRRISKIDETVEIKRDPSGNVIMPLAFGAIVVLSLGQVVTEGEKFHSRRYIFPLGYISKRTYYSLKNPASRCWYIQEVLSSTSEPKEPLFRLTCEDDPEHPIQSSTPSGVWSEVLERIKPQREAIVGRPLHSTISGPEQFGFSHPIIHQLIEDLPSALKCVNYDLNLFSSPMIGERERK